MNKKNKPLVNDYEITEKGSLGLLALGDVGLRAWRKVRNANIETAIDEEE